MIITAKNEEIEIAKLNKDINQTVNHLSELTLRKKELEKTPVLKRVK